MNVQPVTGTSGTVALRVLGWALLLSNVAIGVWLGTVEATAAQKALAMVGLIVLVGLGLACLATASQRRRRALHMAARSGGPVARPDGSGPTSK